MSYPGITYTKAEAYEILADSDHAYLKPDVAVGIAKAFGLTVKPQKEMVNFNDPHGLYVDGAKNGDWIEGYDSRDLADAIARHLNPKFSNPMSGRGFGLRHALRNIATALGGVDGQT